jgi:hypothetical protein
MITTTVTTLLLAGCSGGGAEPTAEPTGTATSDSTSTASEDAGPTEPPPPEPVDPCSLLTTEDLSAAGVDADVEGAVRGLAPDPNTMTCLAPHPKEGWAAYYGFSTRPGVAVKEAIAEVGTEKPVELGVGDDSAMVLYAAYGDKVWHAWASEGKYAVMVELWRKPRPADVEKLLSTLLAQATPEMFDFPVDLPDGCPPARTKAITDLIGPVATAIGSEREDDLRCDYANRRGLSLNLTASPMESAGKVRTTVGKIEQYFDERVAVGKGVTLFLAPGEGYAYTSTFVEKPAATLGTGLQSMTVIGDYYRPLSYDREKYRALALWWSKQRPELLG